MEERFTYWFVLLEAIVSEWKRPKGISAAFIADEISFRVKGAEMERPEQIAASGN
ncbi:MAG: hypothetical protein NC121_03520 [Blautia sp.]|nr:hypothetical protein [Blautia sp.]